MGLIVYIIAHAFAVYVLFVMIYLIVGGVIWFPTLFLGIWLSVLFIISRTFWRPLHDAFPATHDRKCMRYFMVRATFGMCHFALNAAVGESGLTLSAVPMFRLFHPPIHVPWSEIELSYPRPKLTRLAFTEQSLPDMYLFRRLDVERNDNRQDV